MPRPSSRSSREPKNRHQWNWQIDFLADWVGGSKGRDGMACLFVKLAVTGHGNNGCPPDWLPSPAAGRCVSASADACCPSDSSRSKPHSLPNNTPRKNGQAPLRQSLPTSFASSMGHALLCSSLVSKDRLAPCNRPHFQFPMPTSSCQIAEQPLTDQRGRSPPLPACTVCAIPCGARGGSTGCAACQPFSGRPFPFSCTTPRALFSSPDLGRYRSFTYPCPWRGGQHV